mmetsp:Transcript_17347/g.29680  ORF Transcript_17347/g.29680 Transcript_17347/m.29680 type:complete len:236 (+) Transcript_17347:931-1638(+)
MLRRRGMQRPMQRQRQLRQQETQSHSGCRAWLLEKFDSPTTFPMTLAWISLPSSMSHYSLANRPNLVCMRAACTLWGWPTSCKPPCQLALRKPWSSHCRIHSTCSWQWCPGIALVPSVACGLRHGRSSWACRSCDACFHLAVVKALLHWVTQTRRSARDEELGGHVLLCKCTTRTWVLADSLSCESTIPQVFSVRSPGTMACTAASVPVLDCVRSISVSRSLATIVGAHVGVEGV